jgi:iron complex outermembrane receptor protein
MIIQRLHLPVLAMLLIAACWQGLQAQNITINGVVRDKIEKVALEGTTVKVDGVEGKGAYSDENGKFSIQLPKAEKYTLVLTYVGYDTIRQEVVIRNATSYEVEIDMSPEGVTGETVVITQGRHEQALSEVPVSMEVITSQQVDLQATTTIQEVLEQSPGVDIKDDQLNIRGSSGFAYGVGSRVMIMLNGLPLLSPDAAFAQFDLIPVDNINQIEIMKGAASVLYGSSALGGVVNVITNDAPEKPMTNVRMRGAMFDRPANPLLDWDGQSSAYQASIDIYHSRRIKNQDFTVLLDLNKDSGYRLGQDREQVRGMIMTKFRPKGIQGLTFGANLSARTDSSGAILYWNSYEPDTTYRQIVGPTGSITYDTVLTGGGLTAAPGTLRKQYNTRQIIDPFIKYLTPKGNIYSYKGRVMRTTNSNNTGQSNNNYLLFNDFQYITKLFKKLTWVSGVTVQSNGIRGDSLYGGKHDALNLAAYTQLDAKIERLNMTFGARYDRWTYDGGAPEAAPIFRAGINYKLFAGNNVRASFGQAFRSPSAAERYTSTVAGGLYISPNPDLRVEKGFSAEIGMRQGFKFNPTKKSRIMGFVDVAGFMMDYHDMIEFGLDTILLSPTFEFQPYFSAVNISDARITGIEATCLLDYTADKFNLQVSGGITQIDPRNLNPTPADKQLNLGNPTDFFQEINAWGAGLKEDNPVTLKYRERTTVRFSGTIGYDKFWLNGQWRLKSRMETYDQFLNIAVVDAFQFYQDHPNGYQIWDFVLGAELNPNTTMSFHVDNAFQEEYVIIPGLLAPQRKFSVQIKQSF